jgi:hypothetical protein
MAIGPGSATMTTSALAVPDQAITYVCNQVSANVNFDASPTFVVGNYNGYWAEAYIEFNASARPTNWISATFQCNLAYVSAPVNLSVSSIIGSWNASTVTWNTRPTHSLAINTQLITQQNFSQPIRYSVDITTIAKNATIAVCLNASNSFQIGYVIGITDRNTGAIYTPPQLIWTYLVPVTSGIPGYIPFFLLAGLGIGIALIICNSSNLKRLCFGN